MKKLLMVFCLLGFLLSCKSHPEAVNSGRELPVFMPVGTNHPGGAAQGPLFTAVAGKVLLKSEFPIPLARIRIGLYKLTSDSKKLVHEFSSDESGAFQITRPLDRGLYELSVTDPRYEGNMRVSLVEKPATDLIFEVNKK